MMDSFLPKVQNPLHRVTIMVYISHVLYITEVNVNQCGIG